MGRNLLALVKREKRHADKLILYKRLADDLPLHVLNKVLKAQLFLLFNVLIHDYILPNG